MTLRKLAVLESPDWAPHRAPRRPVPAAGPLREFATEDVALPSFHVWTLGCQMNQSDSEEMAGALLAAGCAEAESMDSADLIVINSCAIREAAEARIIGRQGQLAKLKAANPGLRVVLTGCAVRTDNRDRLARRFPAVDLFLRPDEEGELVPRLGLASPTAPGLLASSLASSPERAAATDVPSSPVSATPAGHPSPAAGGKEQAARPAVPLGARALAVRAGQVARRSRVHAWLPIIYGCDKMCTYCIVPFSRGPERSRPFDDVLAEARRLAEDGYREVTLLGQNVNSYGHDLPAEPRFEHVHGGRDMGRQIPLDGRPDIAELIRAIDAIRTSEGAPAIPRLRFITSHPWDLGERLISAMAECPSLCEHLHLPVQSGSDPVLRRMGRQYTVASYLELVDRLRQAVPGICLTTDVIVGFCGETEAQFSETLALLERVRFDTVFAAAFSPRPGTPAARLPDDVPPGEKRRRLNQLLALQETIGWERNRAWLGRVTEVLVDGIDRGGEPGLSALRLSGRNRENKLVHCNGPAELLGQLVHVRVEHAGPYSLAGSLVEAEA
ncbi:MAG: MiaB/RimO family radical SAM methylthiotransferase [Candidatus Limnocylindrales bacterium]